MFALVFSVGTSIETLLAGEIDPVVLAPKIALVLALTVFAYVLALVVNKKLFVAAVQGARLRWDQSTLHTTRKAIGYGFAFLGFLFGLQFAGLDVTLIMATIGVGALAVIVSSQDTVANIIAGFVIIFDRPYRVGDRIAVGSTWGDVFDIGLRSTKIRTDDGVVVTIPNAELAKRDVYNYTIYDKMVMLRIPVGIAYEADFEKAKKLILDICSRTEILREPAPNVFVTGYGDSAINLEVRAWIKNARDKHLMTSILLEEMKKEFDANRVEIPYPRRYLIMDRPTNAAGLARGERSRARPLVEFLPVDEPKLLK
jgi:small-conductance mechanosensitive channel